MKILKQALVGTLFVGLCATVVVSGAEVKKEDKAKPYTLKTCVVSDEKLDAMGKPYVFTESGREIKLCCKGCLKEFNKNKEKFLKKIDDEEKKAAEKKNAEQK
jgi:hypothetical protein